MSLTVNAGGKRDASDWLNAAIDGKRIPTWQPNQMVFVIR